MIEEWQDSLTLKVRKWMRQRNSKIMWIYIFLPWEMDLLFKFGKMLGLDTDLLYLNGAEPTDAGLLG